LKAAVLVFAMLLFGCMAETVHVYAQTRDPDQLYRAKCTACHRLYQSKKHTYNKLQTYVTRYGKGLSDEERRRLLEYLKENAKDEPKGGGEMGN